MPLRGAAKDPEDGEVTDLAWTLTKPDGTPTSVGSGSVVDLPAPFGGWPSGTYTVTLTATDFTGRTDVDHRTVVVSGDRDHNGLPDGISTPTCQLTDAFADADGDGIPNLDDFVSTGAPCTPATAYNATAVFNPDPLPMPSTGNTVTVYVTIPFRDPALVNSATVKISEVDGRPTSFGATAWTVSAGVATAKFDRQKLLTYLAGQKLGGRRVAFTIQGTAKSGTWSFTALTTTQVSR